MADNSRLELVVEVDVNKANASIKSINTGLSSMEQAAGNAARGASAGIDGMTASMIKGATAGNLLADAIKGALNWAKEWTIGAIQAAAAEDKMMASMVALAKANGVAASSAERAVEAVRKVGFHGDEAATAIGRLIIMDVSLAKARGLAIIAKDAAASATESISAADALGKITQALEFGNARALRSIGLKVDFTRALWVEENRLGRALTDNEAISLRLIEVEKAAVAIRGAGAAVSATAAGQQTKLAREVHELKEAIGAEFQGYLKAWVSTQRDLVAFLTENSSFLIKFGSGVLVLAGIIGTITAATKLWALAQGAANLAMVANPAGLLAVGVTGAAVVGYSAYRQMQEDQQQQFAASRQQQLRTMAAAPGGIAQLRRQGVSDADLREAFAGRKRNLAWGTEDAPEDAADMPWAKVPKLNLEGGPDLDALKLAAEIRKKQGENERFFAGRAIAAGSVGKTGFAKDAVEMSADIAGRTSFVDERGVAHQVALTQRAMASIIEEARLKFDAYEVHVAESNRKVTADDEKAWRALSEKRIEWDGQLFAQRLKHDQEASEKAYEHAQTLYGFEEQRAGFARDADLRVAEAVEPRTLQAKVELERRKTEIEIGYLEKVHAVKQHLYDI
ncbi:MAG: hypothetical protein NTW28_25045, partial [Candidatus Solibacter sp.]|nr:hypothetical protein [Candidatus Solibacter sp.]